MRWRWSGGMTITTETDSVPFPPKTGPLSPKTAEEPAGERTGFFTSPIMTPPYRNSSLSTTPRQRPITMASTSTIRWAGLVIWVTVRPLRCPRICSRPRTVTPSAPSALSPMTEIPPTPFRFTLGLPQASREAGPWRPHPNRNQHISRILYGQSGFSPGPDPWGGLFDCDPV